MIKSNQYVWWMPVVLLVLFFGGCKNADDLQGKYLAEIKEDSSSPSIKLELGPNGQGSWAMKGEKVFFRWETQGQEVWLHTKSGGVVAGRIWDRGPLKSNCRGPAHSLSGRFNINSFIPFKAVGTFSDDISVALNLSL